MRISTSKMFFLGLKVSIINIKIIMRSIWVIYWGVKQPFSFFHFLKIIFKGIIINNINLIFFAWNCFEITPTQLMTQKNYFCHTTKLLCSLGFWEQNELSHWSEKLGPTATETDNKSIKYQNKSVKFSHCYWYILIKIYNLEHKIEI